jgi:hypothetical protein
MKSFHLALQREGALVEAELGIAAVDALALRRAGRPVPGPVPLKVLIDTGAEVSCVDAQALAPLIALGLTPTRHVLTNLPATGGLNFASEYAVSLTVLHPSRKPKWDLQLRNLLVVEQSLAALGYQALLGRDALARCLLIYDGPSHSFTLSY